jgi:hypothetical protein
LIIWFSTQSVHKERVTRGVICSFRSEASSAPMLETIRSILNGASELTEDFRSAVIEKVEAVGWADESLTPPGSAAA